MPETCLIGYSGFIGGNLARQHSFDDRFRSTDIEKIRGRSYDLLVCAGVSAVKWKANRAPAEDRAAIENLLVNVRLASAKRVVLISTVDVYPEPVRWDETFDPHDHSNHPYGTNRLYVEDSFRGFFDKVHIVRLPGMFGPGLKKNVVYDLLHGNNLDSVHPDSSFQYYDVRRLWRDMLRAMEHDLSIVNFATQPVETRRLISRYFPGTALGAKATGAPPAYDMKTQYAALLGGSGSYIYDAEQVLAHMGDWIEQTRRGAAA